MKRLEAEHSLQDFGGFGQVVWYKTTSGCVAENFTALANLENMGVAVGILFLHVVELQISATISQFYRSTDYFRFWSRHLGLLV